MATIFNGLGTATLQVGALASMSGAEYGYFSLQYLLAAFGGSLSLSFVCEAWIRTSRGQRVERWTSYSAFSVYVSLVMATLCFCVSEALPPLRHTAVPALIAVGLQTYRTTARFYAVHVRQIWAVILGDIAGVVAFIALWKALVFVGLSGVSAFVWAWAATSVVQVAFSRPPASARLHDAGDWWRANRQSIVALLRNSLLVDAGAIGTPYLVAPLLGSASFGIYRGVSSMAAPVRLLITPLRPVMAGRPLAVFRRYGFLLGALAAGLVIAAVCLVGLRLASNVSRLNGTVISGLASYPAAVGLFILSCTVSNIYYVVARHQASQRTLFVGSIVQAPLALALPLAGASLFDLGGAIWGFTIAGAIASAVWVLLVRSERSPSPTLLTEPLGSDESAHDLG